ncbi:MAG: hypothetical protein ACOYOF_12825, partial [Verrucomicrobiaceae bacterium]
NHPTIRMMVLTNQRTSPESVGVFVEPLKQRFRTGCACLARVRVLLGVGGSKAEGKRKNGKSFHGLH